MIYGEFTRPTDHYDEKLKEIDEEICKLIEQRKSISDHPGFPADELISAWAKKYGFYEDFLNGLFGHLLAEEHFVPVVIPKNFLKNMPVLKTFSKDAHFYTLTFIRQYENASVVNLTIDDELYENEEDDIHDLFVHDLKLYVEDPTGRKYSCIHQGGGGFSGHIIMQYVVSPPLPEDLAGVKLRFSEEMEKNCLVEFEL